LGFEKWRSIEGISFTAAGQEAMKKPSGSGKAIVRYILFQIPSYVLLILILILIRQWVNLHAWVLWGVIVLWLAKDAILFPFVWRAYDRDRLRELQSLVGTEGIVEERLAPSGYIRVHGELWQAERRGDGSPVEKGEIVKIQKIEGLKLLVGCQEEGKDPDR
jgi:membrane protein implicated in regulation of membrane protease activity